ncbi:flagellar biosynthesis protein FlhF [Clostridium amazonitimonense]|uniref:flagellar biosynthesis protein FlhF n=1 Tax=Clostridium amazonitimonense TaxID=1499689 RepID=UPI000509A4F6|nr:flagellar biosynthesis protein FlhF [Clostridium amazonitimonense]
MIIKKYIVNNMNEAMTRIRYELGKEAVIVSQRKIRKPGIKGFFSKKIIEVTAAVENPSEGNNEDSMQNSLDAIRNIITKENQKELNTISKNTEDFSKNEKEESSNIASSNSVLNAYKESLKNVAISRNIKDEPETIKYNSNPNASQDIKDHNKNREKQSDKNDILMREMQEMKSILSKIAVKSDTSIGDNAIERNNKEDKFHEDLEGKKIYNFLKELDMEESLIDGIIKDVKSMEEPIEMKEKIRNIILKKVEISSNNSFQNKVVLVGPTGVGKTTTIAKLAGKMALLEKKKVGLITVDTYRIGAVEQLRTYADIMSIPFKVVINQKEMEEAINSMEDRDVVLIDTTGRSSKNIMQISELRAYIDKVSTENIHLVISCTTKNKDIESIVEGYKVLNYNNVIITKLDETSSYGSILHILNRADRPLSLVTTGQNVPDDIKVMDKEELSNLILGEDNIC